MRLAERFKRLSLWNKIGALGAIASIAAIPLALILWRFSGSPPAVNVQVNSQITQNLPTEQGKKNGDSDTQSSLVFSDTEAIPQTVNRKLSEDRSGIAMPLGTQEIATFRFRVRNQGSAPLAVSSAELLVEKSRSVPYSVQTMAFCTPIDHSGHVKVTIDKASAGDVIPVPLKSVVPPGVPHEFVVWFASPDAVERRLVLFITGRLRLRYEGGPAISNPIGLEIHSEHEAHRLHRP